MDDELIPLVFDGLDYAWERLRGRLDGITDAEYLWEPVPGTWSVRPLGDGWAVEREIPDPQPAPVTSIAWRTWHIASDCLATYSESLGAWALPVTGRQWYGEAAPALAAMDTAYATFRERVTGLGEQGIRRPLGPDWGPFAEDSWAALVIHALDEVAHHGAEIALLRDLHAHQP